MPYKEVTFKTRKEWEAEIQKTIGSSAVATIMGANPWDTPLQLYGRMRGELPAKERTVAMRAGHAAESLIAQLYSEETGRVVHDPGDYTIQTNPDYPWLHCTVDRFSQRRDGEGVVEGKNVGWRLRNDWLDGTPVYVQMQIQEQLAVTGLAWGSAAALLGGQEFVYEDHERNGAFIGVMLKKTKEFWERVQNGDPPEAQAEDVKTMRLLYADYQKGKVIELEDDASEHDRMRTLAIKDIKQAETVRDWHTVKLQELIGDAESGRLPGGGGYVWQTVNRKGYSVGPTSYRDFRRTNK
jgi:putative phage-type endonuclease